MGIELTIAPNGRVVIPADVRKALGLDKGGKVILDVGEFGMTLSTAQQRVRKAKALYTEYSKGKPSDTVEDFLRDKREEAALENAEFDREYS